MGGFASARSDAKPDRVFARERHRRERARGRSERPPPRPALGGRRPSPIAAAPSRTPVGVANAAGRRYRRAGSERCLCSKTTSVPGRPPARRAHRSRGAPRDRRRGAPARGRGGRRDHEQERLAAGHEERRGNGVPGARAVVPAPMSSSNKGNARSLHDDNDVPPRSPRRRAFWRAQPRSARGACLRARAVVGGARSSRGPVHGGAARARTPGRASRRSAPTRSRPSSARSGVPRVRLEASTRRRAGSRRGSGRSTSASCQRGSSGAGIRAAS